MKTEAWRIGWIWFISIHSFYSVQSSQFSSIYLRMKKGKFGLRVPLLDLNLLKNTYRFIYFSNSRKALIFCFCFCLCFFYRGNCTLPTCDLVRFNNAHLWFKSCHFTHLRWPPLDPRYPPLPFSLENLIYYISQN